MFAESLQLPYPAAQRLPRTYGDAAVWGPILNATLSQVGIAERAFFLIDKEGIVRQRWAHQGRGRGGVP